MAYYKKYSWSGKDMYGRTIDLSISQKADSAFTPLVIGYLQGLQLEVEGDGGDVCAPVIKTSLRVTLVDAPDIIEAGKKYGRWEEFYTPDSEMYVADVTITDGSSVRVWSGYLTPDSWEESLEYRGTVTLTFRDNIGHLQDFDFDAVGNANGLISCKALLEAALNKVNYRMTVSFPNTHTMSYVNVAELLENTYVNVSMFKGGTWYDAFEGVLDSLGYAFRWVVRNPLRRGVFLPLRDLPIRGYASRTASENDTCEVEFYGGTRTLDPAYREIVEEIRYDYHELNCDVKKASSWYDPAQSRNYTGIWLGPGQTITGVEYRMIGQAGLSAGWMGGWGFLQPDQFEAASSLIARDGGEALTNGVILTADGDEERTRVYMIPCRSTGGTLHVEFSGPMRKTSALAYTTIGTIKNSVHSVEVKIYYKTKSGHLYYWNGDIFQDTTEDLRTINVGGSVDSDASIDIKLPGLPDGVVADGWLCINFVKIHTFGTAFPEYGSYVAVRGIDFDVDIRKRIESDTVTTVNNAAYNVRAKRSPKVSPLSKVVPFVTPDNYRNALYAYDGNGDVIQAPYWYRWDDEGTTSYPLPAQVHRQMLCYYHTPLSVLDGDIGAVDKTQVLHPTYIFTYKNRQFLLTSGTWDIIRCRIDGAILREFIWFDDLWPAPEE